VGLSCCGTEISQPYNPKTETCCVNQDGKGDFFKPAGLDCCEEVNTGAMLGYNDKTERCCAIKNHPFLTKTRISGCCIAADCEENVKAGRLPQLAGNAKYTCKDFNCVSPAT